MFTKEAEEDMFVKESEEISLMNSVDSNNNCENDVILEDVDSESD